MKNTFEVSIAGKPARTLAYDYENQGWVENGRYLSCSHPAIIRGCFACVHAGEAVRDDADLGS